MEDELKKQIKDHISKILEDGISENNLKMLGDLIDIHKDVANEEYWQEKEDYMRTRYRNDGRYNDYGPDYRGGYGARSRDGRGRYMSRGNYRGEEMLDEMVEYYREYLECLEDMARGNYGAEDGTMKSLDNMLKSATEFIEMLKKDASSEEEMDLIRKYTKKMSEM